MIKTRVVYFVSTFGVLIALSCRAQDELFTLTLEELQNVPIAVATKTNVQLKYAPSTVSYFSAEQIKLLGIETLSELFTHIPGFYSMYNSVEGNQSYLIARGHPQKYANTLLVLVNGQRLNEDYTGGINYIDRFVSLHNVDKVEVIRGPGSTLYGSNAFHGVINIVTKVENYLELSIGSFAKKELNGGLVHQFDDLMLGIDIHWYKDNGDTLDNVFDRFALQETTSDAHESKQLELLAKYKNFTFRNHYLNSTRDNHYLFRRLRDGTNNVDTKHWLSRLEYETSEQDIWTLNVGMEYSKARRKSLSALELRGTGPFEQSDFLFGENFTHDSYRANADYSYQVGDSHRLSVGAEVVRSQVPGGYLRSNYDIFGDLDFFGEVVELTQPSQRIVQDKKRKIRMAYGQLESNWNERWRSTIGLRRDGYNDVEDKTNPRATIIYAPNNAHTFKLIYGEAYRVPSLGDLYDEESGLTVGNNQLKPTTLEALEMVYQYVNQDFTFSTSFYRNKISELIDFRVEGDNVFLGNIADNKAEGLELEWQARIFPNLELKGFITHLFSNKTTIEPGQTTSPSDKLVPKTYAMTSLLYAPSEHWSMSLSMSGRSGVDTLVDKDSNKVLSGTLNYQVNSNSTITLDVNNLLDKTYSTAAIIPFGEKAGKPFGEYRARGRDIKLSYRYLF
ncbi:TonB-dependent receptor plug domain-containing protein [Pseudoalteromonas sp. S16_S37]|uniref:TonB-dependent receptor plug domain-containing protein n=1 Tax=Pseudoalteromonas sp. S16_S37 TaxID=2720228 RepID=UPI00167FE852|nr:TonB-dependent receptor [Pseudoalteromonas sp. S16_S37]MBD1583229.1 TonB-dependent receptor [Pseudoalteromonas sp. S16_S37]